MSISKIQKVTTSKNTGNIWTKLPWEQPFVLPEDKDIIDDVNQNLSPEHRFHLELLPEPYYGNPDAPIILLNANPGYSPCDEKDESQPEFKQALNSLYEKQRLNLLHEKQDYPFCLVNPAFSNTSGGDYWRRHLKELIQKFGDMTVAESVFLIEYYPYHSICAGKMPPIPSQQYSFDLLQKAIKRNATIIIIRKEKEWRKAVPELNEEYKNVWKVNNPRAGTVSIRNLPVDAWQRICNILSQRKE
ncbi:MAG: hypothetical protein LBQ50_07065 [Planctomycetaceae bacterium]|jgi:hypothetical protein|nr:hypothetical protein [Planctomycetaceae bacterium]